MKDIESRINKVEALLDEGTISSLTYAALESRFTIELICYERLMAAYGYTSWPQKLSATPEYFAKVLPHVLPRTQH